MEKTGKRQWAYTGPTWRTLDTGLDPDLYMSLHWTIPWLHTAVYTGRCPWPYTRRVPCAPMCLDIHWIYSAVHWSESYTVCWMYTGPCTTIPCMCTGMYSVTEKALAWRFPVHHGHTSYEHISAKCQALMISRLFLLIFPWGPGRHNQSIFKMPKKIKDELAYLVLQPKSDWF